MYMEEITKVEKPKRQMLQLMREEFIMFMVVETKQLQMKPMYK